MPKGQEMKALGNLLDKAVFKVSSGDAFAKLREAAKLKGVHHVVIEMGQRIIKQPGVEGGTFHLATPELKARADEIEEAFASGLRKVARVYGQKMAVKTSREGDILSFWYEPQATRAKKKA